MSSLTVLIILTLTAILSFTLAAVLSLHIILCFLVAYSFVFFAASIIWKIEFGSWNPLS